MGVDISALIIHFIFYHTMEYTFMNDCAQNASSLPHATIIVNPASRSGLRVYHSLEKHIDQFFHYDVKFTKKRGHAADLAKHAEGPVIIVCGGDGTINEVANGIVERQDVVIAPTFGGSGCDLGRLFGIERGVARRIHEIYEKLHTNRLTRMRLSLVETRLGRRFFIGVGDAGFGAEVAILFDSYRKFGKFGYIIGIIRALIKIRPVRVSVTVDGARTADTAMMVMFARSKYYAGGLKVSPNSDHLSGEARMIFLKWIRKLTFLRYFPTIFTGSHIAKYFVEERAVRRLEIDTPGLLVDVEGEFAGHTPCTFSITDTYITVV